MDAAQLLKWLHLCNIASFVGLTSVKLPQESSTAISNLDRSLATAFVNRKSYFPCIIQSKYYPYNKILCINV